MSASVAWVSDLPSSGEMGARVVATDWEATPLGPMEQWPTVLRVATTTVLSSRFPMMIAWGEELVQLYNDAFIPIFGTKHPQLARRVQDAWAETFEVVGPLMRGVLDDGEPFYAEDALMWVDRIGIVEDTYFTFSYSRLWDEDGGVGGVLITAMETTQRVLDARRLGALSALNDAVANSLDAGDAMRDAMAALAGHPEDLPFAAAYLRDPATGGLHLAATAGVPAGSPLVPAVIDDGATGAWPAPLLGGGVVDLPGDHGVVHPVSDRPVRAARVVPLGDRGMLVAGLSPSRRRDEAYEHYLDLVASAMARSLQGAEAIALERERADALAELDQAKNEFLENVSHELRTPLTLVRAPVTELLEETVHPLAPTQRATLELVQRNTERLLRLVDGLLAFSRASAAPLHPEPTDLTALTGQLVELFRHAADQAGLTLEVSLAGAGTAVAIDRDAWERIVMNLLSNAVKYTEHGGIRVGLHIGGDSARLEVTDTGVGIDALDAERIFERFGRVRHDGARSFEGVGIGLALVRQLAQRMGGDVTVESTVGRGSRFVVQVAAPALPDAAATVDGLPSAAAAAVAREAESWGATPAATAEGGSADRPLVLCADDNADMRAYLAETLGGAYRVRLVADAAAALAAAREEHPDLILTDIMMPGIDGLDLVRQLRADPELAPVPVVLLSARAGDEASVEGLELGADDYIVKPFSARELQARIRAHIELSRTREALTRAEHEQQTAVLMDASERRLRTALGAASTGIALGDLAEDGEARLTDVNPALCMLLHRSAATLRGCTLRELTMEEDLPILLAEQERLAAGDVEHATLELRLLRGDDDPMWAAIDLSVARGAGGTPQFVASIRDSAERRRDESRLRYLADHDVLTGLLNRRRFGEELGRVIAEAQRYPTGGAVLMLDLDGLKTVNDRLGHSQGDKLLCGIADLMRSRLRRTDVLGRLGGDEFALLLPHTSADDAETIARELQHRIRQSAPVLLGGAPARLTASVGIALLEGGPAQRGPEVVMAEADSALYMAKHAGRDCIRVASPALRHQAARLQTDWTDRLLEALAEDRFELFAQPIIGICGDARPRYELLLRLRGDDGTMLTPGSFIPDAERSELIVEIDRWVIRRSMAALRDWQQARGPVSFHVNLSSHTVTTSGTAELIADELARTGVSGSDLVYEITETTAIASIDRAQEFAAQLRRMDCRLALDDFGSGFASFAYLKHLDYDFVKLDGALVSDVSCNLRDERILRCLADLAHGMGKHAVAECVPDQPTVELLQSFGVEYAQGYYLGRPAPLAL